MIAVKAVSGGGSTEVPESFFDKNKENEEIFLDYYRAERTSPDGPHDIEARHLTMVGLLINLLYN